MYFQYGIDVRPLNEAALVISRDTLLNDEQVPWAIRHKWDIQGYLQADDPAGITAAILALEAAYSIQGQNATLLLNDGTTPSAHRLISNQCIGGVRVTSPVSYEKGDGAEYSTFRHYRIGLEAIVPTNQISLIAWDETLSFSGGGPRDVWIEVRNGPPQKQRVSLATIYEVRQSGRAIGLYSYPFAARPIWPDAEILTERRSELKLPKYTGQGATRTLTEFEVSWSYVFRSDQQLFGTPSPRPRD